MFQRKDICFITCPCGCDNGMVAKILNGQVFLSFVSRDFYTKQESFGKLKLALKLMGGKKLLKEVLCNEEDLKVLRDFLKTATYDDNDSADNDSHVVIGWDEYFGYSINLISDIKKRDAIKLKNHRAFDIVLSKEERDLLVKRINHSLKKHERQYITLGTVDKKEN